MNSDLPITEQENPRTTNLSSLPIADVVRLMNGATDGREAAPGTIRGDFGLSKSENLVHGSDSADAAKREIGIFFPDLVDQGSSSGT